MRVRIVTDKTDGKTWPRVRFIDAETGEVIKGVFDCDIALPLDDIPRATLKFWAEIDGEFEAEYENVCPCCKQVVPEKEGQDG